VRANKNEEEWDQPEGLAAFQADIEGVPRLRYAEN